MHIVFGLNEAGKSTALSGYLDLLFGIEERSRYNFLHEYSAMRIGGVLEFAEEAHVLAHETTEQLVAERNGPTGERSGDNGTSRRSVPGRIAAPCSRWTTTLEAGGKCAYWSRVETWASSEHMFTRTKQRSSSLLDAMGQLISERGSITANLAGPTRGDAYRTMFSLDDETLEAGGKSILESAAISAGSFSRPPPVLGMQVRR